MPTFYGMRPAARWLAKRGFGDAEPGWEDILPRHRATQQPSSSAGYQAGQQIGDDMMRQQFESYLKNMRGTNVIDLVQNLKKTIDSTATRTGIKDHKGNFRFQSQEIQQLMHILDGVVGNLEKNEQNIELNEKQQEFTRLGIDKMLAFIRQESAKDPRNTTEGRMIEELQRQLKENASAMLTEKNMAKVSSGQDTREDKKADRRNTQLRETLRSGLYSLLGPAAPMLQSLDDLIVAFKDNSDEIKESVKKLTTPITEFMTKTGGWFRKSLEFFKKFKVGGGAGGDGFGIGDLFSKKGWGKIGGGVRGVGRGLLNFAKSGAGRVLGGVAGAGMLGYGLYSGFNKGKDPNETTGDKVMSYGGNALSGAMTGMAVAGPVGAAVGAIVGLVGTAISRNWDSIADWTSDAMAGAGKLYDKAVSKTTDAIEGVATAASSMWTGAKETFSSAIDGLASAFASGKDMLNAAWDKFKEKMEDVGMSIADKFKTAMNFVRHPIDSTRQAVSGAAATVQKKMQSWGQNLDPNSTMGRAVNGIGSFAGKLVSPTGDVKNAIMEASAKAGVDPAYMMAMARQESGFNPNATAGTSSASGLYQFTNGTWKDMVGKYGQQYGIGLGDRMDAKANAMMGALYAKDNQAALTKTLGRAPNATEMYAGHFLGTGGAQKFLSAMSADKNRSAVEVMGGKVADANKSIFYNKDGSAKTLDQVYSTLGQKIEPYQKAYAQQIATTPDGKTASASPATASSIATALTSAATGQQPFKAPGGAGSSVVTGSGAPTTGSSVVTGSGAPTTGRAVPAAGVPAAMPLTPVNPYAAQVPAAKSPAAGGSPQFQTNKVGVNDIPTLIDDGGLLIFNTSILG